MLRVEKKNLLFGGSWNGWNKSGNRFIVSVSHHGHPWNCPLFQISRLCFGVSLCWYSFIVQGGSMWGLVFKQKSHCFEIDLWQPLMWPRSNWCGSPGRNWKIIQQSRRMVNLYIYIWMAMKTRREGHRTSKSDWMVNSVVGLWFTVFIKACTRARNYKWKIVVKVENLRVIVIIENYYSLSFCPTFF